MASVMACTRALVMALAQLACPSQTLIPSQVSRTSPESTPPMARAQDPQAATSWTRCHSCSSGYAQDRQQESRCTTSSPTQALQTSVQPSSRQSKEQPQTLCMTAEMVSGSTCCVQRKMTWSTANTSEGSTTTQDARTGALETDPNDPRDELAPGRHSSTQTHQCSSLGPSRCKYRSALGEPRSGQGHRTQHHSQLQMIHSQSGQGSSTC